MEKCLVLDCDKKYNAKGYCKKHYERFRLDLDITRRLKTDPNQIIVLSDYAEILLYNNKGLEVGRTLIDIEDVSRVKGFKWHFSGNYVEAKDNGTKIMLHKFVLNAKQDKIVDHKNGIETDNRKNNLRICIHQQNMFNSKKPTINTSGYRGVTWHKRNKKWMSSIQFNKKNIFLGYYLTKEEANEVRLKAESKYFREYSPSESRGERIVT